MNAIQTLEMRVADLERSLADLRQMIASRSTSPNWIERMKGCVNDREAFQEAMEYGRQYRYADRPDDQSSDAS